MARTGGYADKVVPPLVLLCPAQDAAYLVSILKAHNPLLEIMVAHDNAELDGILSASNRHFRLVAFCTPVIVPAATLERVISPAYNFHPGSPEYPGKYPAQFALYDRAARFGATAHEMAAKVDSGPIVDALHIDSSAMGDLKVLGFAAHFCVIQLFQKLSRHLATSSEPLPRSAHHWGSRDCSQKAAEALCAIPPDIEADELKRRIDAFGATGISFHTRIHGRAFKMVG